jgi:hypothetical protein
MNALKTAAEIASENADVEPEVSAGTRICPFQNLNHIDQNL